MALSLAHILKFQTPTGEKVFGALSDLAAFFGSAPALVVTKENIYEYYTVQAEERANVGRNATEWSWGDGATGFTAIPMTDGWEIIEVGFHSESSGSNSTVEIQIYDFTNRSTAVANLITTADFTSQGSNLMVDVVEIDPPVAFPDGGALGLRTGDRSGSFSDARVTVKLRRLIGEFVTDVSYAP